MLFWIKCVKWLLINQTNDFIKLFKLLNKFLFCKMISSFFEFTFVCIDKLIELWFQGFLYWFRLLFQVISYFVQMIKKSLMVFVSLFLNLFEIFNQVLLLFLTHVIHHFNDHVVEITLCLFLHFLNNFYKLFNVWKENSWNKVLLKVFIRKNFALELSKFIWRSLTEQEGWIINEFSYQIRIIVFQMLVSKWQK